LSTVARDPRGTDAGRRGLRGRHARGKGTSARAPWRRFRPGEPPASAPVAGPGVGAGGNNTGTGIGAAQPIIGTVKLVDGDTVYIVEPDCTVKTSGTTMVTAPGALTNLKPGSIATVQGSTDNGTVTATILAQT
jgi:hypothetical protein